MTVRRAACRCGKLTADCRGQPARISVCHCLACQARSGSAFAAQARWTAADVTISGEERAWERIADSGQRATYHFCPTCGSTLWYEMEAFPGLIAVPIGAFGDPDFPSPQFSVWESRKHSWIALIGDHIEHSG